MGKLRDLYYAFPKTIWVLALAMVINTMGMSMLFPLNTLYIKNVLGGTIAAAGVILMIQQGFNILGNIVGGFSFDKIGPKRTILLGIILSIVLVFTLIFVNSLSVYAVFLILLGLSNGLIFPSIYAMAGALWPEGGRKTFNIIYVANNLGVAFGPIIGGLAFQFVPRLIFVTYTVTFFFFLFLIMYGFTHDNWEKVRLSSENSRSEAAPNGSSFKLRYINFTPLMLLAFGILVAWIPYSQWSVSIAVHINDLGIPYSQYTLLWTINGLVIVLGQPLISFLTTKVLKSLRSQIYAGVVIYIISFLILYFDPFYYLGFVLAMFVITFGEMLAWPAVPTAAAELAPPDKQGLYQGIVSSAGAGGRMFGVLMAGLLFDVIGIYKMYLIMLMLLSLALFIFTIYGRVSRKAVVSSAMQKLKLEEAGQS